MITVIIPALNEEKTIRQVVAIAAQHPQVSEVIVVDDQSVDQTVPEALAAGAKVITSAEKGKGISMKDGIAAARNKVIAFLDADITTYPRNVIHLLTAPILREEADFVKSCFSRQAGRVTELVAKPLLRLIYPFFPDFKQPLSGMIAGKKDYFEKCEFEKDYGVDIGVLIDMYRFGARILEVSIGAIENRMHPLEKLGKMSMEVARTILKKAGISTMNEPGIANGLMDVPETLQVQQESQAQQLVVFDMDNTLFRKRFIEVAAARFGFSEQLAEIRNTVTDPVLRTKRIARLLKGCAYVELMDLVAGMELTPGLENQVDHLRNRQYKIALITDSYDFVGSYFRKNFGFDFIIGNQLEFILGKASGEVQIPSAFIQDQASSCNDSICKSNALRMLLQHTGIAAADTVMIGDGDNDACILKMAGTGIAFCPTGKALIPWATHIVQRPDFSELKPEWF